MSRGRTDKLPLQNARDRHPEKYLRERLGEGPAGEAEHFIRCPACGVFAGADRGAAKARRRARANRPSEWGIGGGVPLLKVGRKSGVLRMLFIW
jgi:hypothetical protein